MASMLRRFSTVALKTDPIVLTRRTICTTVFRACTTGSTDFPVNNFFKNGTTQNRYSSGESLDVKSVIKREIQHEEDSLHDEESINDQKEIEEMKTRVLDGMTLKTEDGSAIVKIFSEQGGESIEICFHVQDTGQFDKDGDVEGEGAKDEESEEYEGEDEGIPFSVIVKKPSGSLHFRCMAGPGAVGIEDVHFYGPGVDVDPVKDLPEDDGTYHGPVFHELDLDLQEAFGAYLEDRGIGSEMGDFIVTYSMVKEKKEYTDWLKKVDKFIS